MKEKDIQEVVVSQLLATPGLPTPVWENAPETPSNPFMIVGIIRNPPASRTLKGLDVIKRGMVSLSLMFDPDEFATASLVVADLISDAFPMGSRFSLGNGVVEIKRPVEIITGYRDGSRWRLPVLIHYEAFVK